MTPNEKATLQIMSVALKMVEGALLLARQVRGASATTEEGYQLAVDISELDLTRDRLTGSMNALLSGRQTTIRPPSPKQIEEIRTLAAKVDTLTIHNVAASTAIQEIGNVLTTAAIIFDPWPGSGGKKP